jgi:hypothetical protein
LTLTQAPNAAELDRSDAQTEPICFQVKRTAMNHFASYWKFFDEYEEATVVTSWRIGAGNRLADAIKGDILWLFTSGRKCTQKLGEDELPPGAVEDGQAYLTEVFTIRGVVPEIAGPFKLLVKGVLDKCIGVCPPILIDDIVRPDGWEKDKQIGSLRQGAWRLPDVIADLLQKKLKQESPNTFRRVFG